MKVLIPRSSKFIPAKDRYHQNLKNALIKDGWTITDDPFHLKWGKKDLYVDLGAEKLLIPFEEEPLGKLILEDYKIPLIVFHPKQEVIVRWVL
ncbi:MAG: element excision factor XisH family protein [Nostoc sp. ChiQUE01a]|nr:element excision factor XisH family protein [Nostoc sp. ChiQUE01a]